MWDLSLFFTCGKSHGPSPHRGLQRVKSWNHTLLLGRVWNTSGPLPAPAHTEAGTFCWKTLIRRCTALAYVTASEITATHGLEASPVHCRPFLFTVLVWMCHEKKKYFHLWFLSDSEIQEKYF